MSGLWDRKGLFCFPIRPALDKTPPFCPTGNTKWEKVGFISAWNQDTTQAVGHIPGPHGLDSLSG